LLPSGLVLAAGGANLGPTHAEATAELYDPATGQWTATGALNVARSRHTATLLPSGTLLVTGGCTAGDLNCNLGVEGSAELYDQASWALTAALPQTLYDHTATLLPSGQVLVAAGASNSGGLPSNAAELYDPGDGQWTRTASLGVPRPEH